MKRDQLNRPLVNVPVLHKALVERATSELEAAAAKELQSHVDLLVGQTGIAVSRLLVEAYKRGLADGFVQGVAAQAEDTRS